MTDDEIKTMIAGVKRLVEFHAKAIEIFTGRVIDYETPIEVLGWCPYCVRLLEDGACGCMGV